MVKTINSESFIEAWEEERCLWYVQNYKNRYEKAKSRKELTEQFSVISYSSGSFFIAFHFYMKLVGFI